MIIILKIITLFSKGQKEMIKKPYFQKTNVLLFECIDEIIHVVFINLFKRSLRYYDCSPRWRVGDHGRKTFRKIVYFDEK